ncbi:MAG: hypothetical protein HYX69_07120 [Planctomycetia bacterium]|nr:hypothetical protein [Planctomycetia bacterium]
MSGRWRACTFAILLVASTTALRDCAGLEIVLIDDAKLVRIEIVVEVDGRPVEELWGTEVLFRRLLTSRDRDGDRTLDAREASRLPSPFAVRQLLWHPLATSGGTPPPFEALDSDKNGKVDGDELAALYRRAGVRGVFVGVGIPPATHALTEALVAALDAHGDRRVGEAEFKAAEQLLGRWDRNDDELVGASELVPNATYPGAAGTTLVSASATEVPGSGSAVSPFIVLPAVPSDTRWAAQIIHSRDRDGDGRLTASEVGWESRTFGVLDADADGRLMADELAGWRKLGPDVRWVVRLGKPSPRQTLGQSLSSPQHTPAAPPLALEAGRLWLSLRVDEGKLPADASAARARFLARFAQADADGDKSLVAKEASERSREDLGQLIAAADDDGDGQLTEQELIRWLDLQQDLIAGHVLLTVLDHGSGLFELLDADHSGGLSIRELRSAWHRIKDTGCVTDGYFDAHKLPRQLIATVSRGHPRSALPTARGAGPDWFVAMDRNGDGDVSVREFLGPTSEFRRLDRDGDGLLSPAEAKPPTENQAAK